MSNMASTSADFKDFIKRKKESHRENAIDYTPESLMLAAENHYNAMKLDGEWNTITVDPPIVLALRAQIKDLEIRNRTGGGGGVGGGGGGGGPPPPPAVRFQGKHAWKAIAPKSGEPATKKVGKYNFHWCTHHGFWTALPQCIANTSWLLPRSVMNPELCSMPLKNDPIGW